MNHWLLPLTFFAAIFTTVLVGCDKSYEDDNNVKTQSVAGRFAVVNQGEFKSDNGDKIILQDQNKIFYEITFSLETLSDFINCKEVVSGTITSIVKVNDLEFPNAKTKLRIRLTEDAKYFRQGNDGRFKVSQVCEKIALESMDGVADFPTIIKVGPRPRFAATNDQKLLSTKKGNDQQIDNLEAEDRKSRPHGNYVLLGVGNKQSHRVLFLKSFSAEELVLGFSPEEAPLLLSTDVFTLSK